MELALNKLRSTISGSSTWRLIQEIESQNSIGDPTIAAAFSTLQKSIQASSPRPGPNYVVEDQENKFTLNNNSSSIAPSMGHLNAIGISNINRVSSVTNSAIFSRAAYVDRVTNAENALRDYDSGKRIRGDINTDFDDRREQLIEELTDAHNALNLFDRHQGTSNYTHVLNQRHRPD